jgi:hypothetical protein
VTYVCRLARVIAIHTVAGRGGWDVDVDPGPQALNSQGRGLEGGCREPPPVFRLITAAELLDLACF